MSEPAVRGEQVPIGTTPERCLAGGGEFTFWPCVTGEDGFAVYVAVGEAPVPSVPSVPKPALTRSLPETGATADLAIIAGVLVLTGLVCSGIRRLALGRK